MLEDDGATPRARSLSRRSRAPRAEALLEADEPKARAIFRGFAFMSTMFSLNHGTVTAVLAIASAAASQSADRQQPGFQPGSWTGGHEAGSESGALSFLSGPGSLRHGFGALFEC